MQPAEWLTGWGVAGTSPMVGSQVLSSAPMASKLCPGPGPRCRPRPFSPLLVSGWLWHLLGVVRGALRQDGWTSSAPGKGALLAAGGVPGCFRRWRQGCCAELPVYPEGTQQVAAVSSVSPAAPFQNVPPTVSQTPVIAATPVPTITANITSVPVPPAAAPPPPTTPIVPVVPPTPPVVKVSVREVEVAIQ